MVARAEGSTVKVASVIYQKAPFCFFSLDPGANVTKLKDFEGLRVGSNTGSYISNIARAMMRKEGLDPSKLSVESIEPSARIAMLATRKIPAIDFFIITKPAMERAVKDAKVVTFLFADHGLDLYSNGIGAKESFLKENQVMKAFVRAALRGYQYAFKHRAEAAELIQKHAKALNNEITVDHQDRRGADSDAGGQAERHRLVHHGADAIVGGLDGRERRLPEGEGAEGGGRLRHRLPAGEAGHASDGPAAQSIDRECRRWNQSRRRSGRCPAPVRAPGQCQQDIRDRGRPVPAVKDVSFSSQRADLAAGPERLQDHRAQDDGRPDPGQRRAAELDGKGDHRPLSGVGVVFQAPTLMPWRRVLGNVLFPMEVLGRNDRKAKRRAQEILELVGLAGFERAYPRQLSGGMQQRRAVPRPHS